MSSNPITPEQSRQLLSLLSTLKGSQLNTYFVLLNDDDVLEKCASASVQTRAQILVTKAKASGADTLLSIVRAVLIDDSRWILLSPTDARVLKQIELSLSLHDLYPSNSNKSKRADGQFASTSAFRSDRKGATAATAESPAAEESTIDPRAAAAVKSAVENQGTPSPVLNAVAIAEATDRTPNSIFLVQGRNQQINQDMDYFLSTLRIKVFTWHEVIATMETPNPYIFDVIKKGMSLATLVLVLMTPDEDVSLRKDTDPNAKPGELVSGRQPRPNVLIEAGMALGMNRSRTLLVEWGSHRAATDLDGMHKARIAGDAQSKSVFISRLTTAGLKPDQQDGRWINAGKFAEITEENSLSADKESPSLLTKGPEPIPQSLVSWIVLPQGKSQYTLVNSGEAGAVATLTAFNDVTPEGDHAAQYAGRLPVELAPSESIPFIIIKSLVSPSVTEIELTWNDSAGTGHRRTLRI